MSKENTNGTLSSVCELIVDCEHKTAPTEAEGYPSIRTPNIGRGRLLLDGVNRVSEETYQLWTRRATPQPNDLILAREAPVGNVAIIPDNLKVCLGQRTVLIRPDKTRVDANYLVNLLLGDEVQARIQSMANGATVGHLNVKDIRELALPKLPSIPTQRKIAAILSAYDDLIENNTRRIKILEEMAQAIYREWFVEFRSPNVELRKASPEEQKLTGKDVFPKGWGVVDLKMIAEVNAQSIKRDKIPETITYIDIASVGTGVVNNIEALKFHNAPSRARRIVRHGDTIWSTVRPNRKSYSLILNPHPNLIVSTGFAVISAATVPFTYLYHVTTTDDFVGYLTNHATGSAYPAVNAGNFENARVILPSTETLKSFHDNAEPLYLLIHSLQTKNTNLRRTRDLLLPKLISGEVEV